MALSKISSEFRVIISLRDEEVRCVYLPFQKYWLTFLSCISSKELMLASLAIVQSSKPTRGNKFSWQFPERTTSPVQELFKSKNRAILFYFLQKQNDRSNDFETLSQISETLWDSARQCLTMSDNVLRQFETVSHCLRTLKKIVSFCLNVLRQCLKKDKFPTTETMHKPQSWHGRMFCSHPMLACFHNKHCWGAATVQRQNSSCPRFRCIGLDLNSWNQPIMSAF
jgi:hypothetical protein